MKWLGLVGGVLALPLCVACGGSEFGSAGAAGTSSAGTDTGGSTSGGSAGASNGGSAGSFPGGSGGAPIGGSSSGGSAGSAAGGTGGTSGGGAAGNSSGGAAGGGGTSPCPTTCDMGEYCDEDAGKCLSCSTIGGRLRFGPPTRLPLNNSAGVDERFPRVDNDGTLWFTRGDGSGSDSVVKLSPPYSGTPSVEYANGSGYIPRGIEGEGLRFTAAFDTEESNGTRKLVGVDGNEGTNDLESLNQVLSTSVAALDFSIAVGEGRVWWMSNRAITGEAPVAHLHTAQPGIVFNIAYVPLVLEDGCHAQAVDFAPWAGKQGNLLLFAAQPLSDGGAGCTASTDGPRDLYWATMGGDGQQLGQAKRIELSEPTLDDTEPSLSPDLCTLIYARSEAVGLDNHDIYTATRR